MFDSVKPKFDPEIPASNGPENNYMLALIIGKRARQIVEGSERLTECKSNNPVTIAICEYKENKIKIGIKKNYT